MTTLVRSFGLPQRSKTLVPILKLIVMFQFSFHQMAHVASKRDSVQKMPKVKAVDACI